MSYKNEVNFPIQYFSWVKNINVSSYISQKILRNQYEENCKLYEFLLKIWKNLKMGVY